jgi:hypothetical protein
MASPGQQAQYQSSCLSLIQKIRTRNTEICEYYTGVFTGRWPELNRNWRLSLFNHFFLFHLNAHNMLNTYIYHLLPPFFDTSSSRRPLRYFLKNYILAHCCNISFMSKSAAIWVKYKYLQSPAVYSPFKCL